MKRKFFDLAAKLSKKSDHPKHKLGAVIVKKGRIVSLGINKYKTHTKSTHDFKYVHAELDAVLSAGDTNLKNATLYVYRETKDGIPAMARCCQSCMKLVKSLGIKKICFTVDGTYFEEWLE